MEPLNDAPSEVEQPFWNTYPVCIPSETPDEGHPNVVHNNVAAQNVCDNLPDMHDRPARIAPPAPI